MGALSTQDNTFRKLFRKLSQQVTMCQPGHYPCHGRTWPPHWFIFIVLVRGLSALWASNSKERNHIVQKHKIAELVENLFLLPHFLVPTYFPWQSMCRLYPLRSVYLASTSLGDNGAGKRTMGCQWGKNKCFPPIKEEQRLHIRLYWSLTIRL